MNRARRDGNAEFRQRRQRLMQAFVRIQKQGLWIHLPNRSCGPTSLSAALHRAPGKRQAQEGAVEGPGNHGFRLSRFTRIPCRAYPGHCGRWTKGHGAPFGQGQRPQGGLCENYPQGGMRPWKRWLCPFLASWTLWRRSWREDTETLIRLLGRFGDALAEAGAQAKERGAPCRAARSPCVNMEKTPRDSHLERKEAIHMRKLAHYLKALHRTDSHLFRTALRAGNVRPQSAELYVGHRQRRHSAKRHLNTAGGGRSAETALSFCASL